MRERRCERPVVCRLVTPCFLDLPLQGFSGVPGSSTKQQATWYKRQVNLALARRSWLPLNGRGLLSRTLTRTSVTETLPCIAEEHGWGRCALCIRRSSLFACVQPSSCPLRPPIDVRLIKACAAQPPFGAMTLLSHEHSRGIPAHLRRRS